MGRFGRTLNGKHFVAAALQKCSFFHRDEFERHYDMKMEYPLILRDEGRLEVAVSRDQMADMAYS